MNNVKKEILNICKYLVLKNYINIFDGNISYRIDNNQVLITPKRKNKYTLSLDDLVILDYDGKKLYGKNEPSGEWRLHLMIYKQREDINAVIHTHPVFSTAISLVENNISKPILVEIVPFLEKIKEIKCTSFYTEKLAESVKKYINKFDIFILKNHGLLTIGKTLDEALFLTEKIEYLAKILFIVKILGKKFKVLSKKEINEIKNLFS
ncbi:MAG: class II aldolase/adducin family protein [Endomicrobia bacterium]|nr:class II aldolase/adducin family protein [Endomicrobiia bacterium]